MHSFTYPSVTAARALILITPGGFEKFFQEVGTAARAGEPGPPFDAADFPRLAEATQRYGGQVLVPTGAPIH